jgi:hypothetical protein
MSIGAAFPHGPAEAVRGQRKFGSEKVWVRESLGQRKFGSEKVWVRESLKPRLDGARVLRESRGWERPSDRLPVMVHFRL